MPAYHLVRPDHMGITMVNIGVGPANAKTITDHIAVLRPHAWVMLGHCAGLRSSQQLGDYVLAHGYVREDHRDVIAEVANEVLRIEGTSIAIAVSAVAMCSHETSG